MTQYFSNDALAIKNFNTKEHRYLSVVKKGREKCLIVRHHSWLGRLWMWLGWSSSSMEKIIHYIASKKDKFCSLSDPLKLKLLSKVKKYQKTHPKFLSISLNLENKKPLSVKKVTKMPDDMECLKKVREQILNNRYDLAQGFIKDSLNPPQKAIDLVNAAISVGQMRQGNAEEGRKHVIALENEYCKDVLLKRAVENLIKLEYFVDAISLIKEIGARNTRDDAVKIMGDDLQVSGFLGGDYIRRKIAIHFLSKGCDDLALQMAESMEDSIDRGQFIKRIEEVRFVKNLTSETK